MSLALSTDGVAYNTVAVASTALALGGITSATFDGGNPAAEVGKLLLLIDTALADANLADLAAPSAMDVADGVELVCINNTNGKKITYTDPNTGYSLDYVNKQGESISLVSSNDTWLVAF